VHLFSCLSLLLWFKMSMWVIHSLYLKALPSNKPKSFIFFFFPLKHSHILLTFFFLFLIKKKNLQAGGEGSLKPEGINSNYHFFLKNNCFLQSYMKQNIVHHSYHGIFILFSECAPKCDYRCSKTSYRKACLTYCNLCCAKCLCVPSGTYGNKQECPCYNNWKNKNGGPKCP